MTSKLTGTAALVTGASSGIGAATTRRDRMIAINVQGLLYTTRGGIRTRRCCGTWR
jgi:hypothetical protein